MNENANNFARRAWQCYRLIAEISDSRTVEQLGKLGQEYVEAAIKAGASADALPIFHRATCFHDGD